MSMKRFLSLFIKFTFLGHIVEFIYAALFFCGILFISENTENEIVLIVALIVFVVVFIAIYFWWVKKLKLFLKSSD